MITIYGDSCVAGYGLADPSTNISNILSELLNVPVMNKGVSGCGPMTVSRLVNASDNIVIIAWPSLVRWEDPDKKNWGPWCFGRKSLYADEYSRLVASREIIDINLKAIEQTRQALANTRLIEYEYIFKKLYMKYPMPNIGVKQFCFLDVAEDGMHPGPETNRHIANWLAESIKKATEGALF
jgi:lysophospholipase L1-like esterase